MYNIPQLWCIPFFFCFALLYIFAFCFSAAVPVRIALQLLKQQLSRGKGFRCQIINEFRAAPTSQSSSIILIVTIIVILSSSHCEKLNGRLVFHRDKSSATLSNLSNSSSTSSSSFITKLPSAILIFATIRNISTNLTLSSISKETRPSLWVSLTKFIS